MVKEVLKSTYRFIKRIQGSYGLRRRLRIRIGQLKGLRDH